METMQRLRTVSLCDISVKVSLFADVVLNLPEQFSLRLNRGDRVFSRAGL